MHERPPSLPFDDDEDSWLPECPSPKASSKPVCTACLVAWRADSEI